PEQAGGQTEQVGPAADQYSAGVVLYELLTGRVPFEGPMPVVMYHAIHTSPPPPSGFRPGLDPALEAICLRALAKQPADRYPGPRRAEQAGNPLDTGPAAPPSRGGRRGSPGPALGQGRAVPEGAALVVAGRGGGGPGGGGGPVALCRPVGAGAGREGRRRRQA